MSYLSYEEERIIDSSDKIYESLRNQTREKVDLYSLKTLIEGAKYSELSKIDKRKAYNSKKNKLNKSTSKITSKIDSVIAINEFLEEISDFSTSTLSIAEANKAQRIIKTTKIKLNDKKNNLIDKIEKESLDFCKNNGIKPPVSSSSIGYTVKPNLYSVLKRKKVDFNFNFGFGAKSYTSKNKDDTNYIELAQRTKQEVESISEDLDKKLMEINNLINSKFTTDDEKIKLKEKKKNLLDAKKKFVLKDSDIEKLKRQCVEEKKIEDLKEKIEKIEIDYSLKNYKKAIENAKDLIRKAQVKQRKQAHKETKQIHEKIDAAREAAGYDKEIFDIRESVREKEIIEQNKILGPKLYADKYEELIEAEKNNDRKKMNEISEELSKIADTYNMDSYAIDRAIDKSIVNYKLKQETKNDKLKADEELEKLNRELGNHAYEKALEEARLWADVHFEETYYADGTDVRAHESKESAIEKKAKEILKAQAERERMNKSNSATSVPTTTQTTLDSDNIIKETKKEEIKEKDEVKNKNVFAAIKAKYETMKKEKLHRKLAIQAFKQAEIEQTKKQSIEGEIASEYEYKGGRTL